jgi:SAM-dependent methyltransferase
VRRWAQYQEPLARCFYEPVFDRLGVEAGTRLLDVGCGAGLAARLAGDRGAQVAGIDLSPASVEFARERTPEGDFRAGDMETLPWEDGSFDAVTGFNSFQFAGDPVNAFKEARRVLGPGGRLAVLIWGPEEDSDQSAVMAATTALAPPSPDERGPFALSPPGLLESLLKDAKLTVRDGDEVACAFEYPDFETMYLAMSSAARAQAVIDLVGEERYRSALRTAAVPFQTPSGGYRLQNTFRFLIAA